MGEAPNHQAAHRPGSCRRPNSGGPDAEHPEHCWRAWHRRRRRRSRRPAGLPSADDRRARSGSRNRSGSPTRTARFQSYCLAGPSAVDPTALERSPDYHGWPDPYGFCRRARPCSIRAAGRRKIFACSTPPTRRATARRLALPRSSRSMSRSVMCWHSRRSRSRHPWRSRPHTRRSLGSILRRDPSPAARCKKGRAIQPRGRFWLFAGQCRRPGPGGRPRSQAAQFRRPVGSAGGTEAAALRL